MKQVSFIFSALLGVSLLILMSACSGKGGGSASGPVAAPLYPSARNSTYQTESNSAKAGATITFSVTVKDQNYANFALGTSWELALRVNCEDCLVNNANPITLMSIAGSTYVYSFRTNETANYSIEADFQPAFFYKNYTTDFPGGIDPNSLYAVALNLPPYSVCMDPTSAAIHGLRGSTIFGGVTYLAVCSGSELALAATDPYFLSQNLYLANDIDLSSYYQSGGAEFSIGNECGSPANCGQYSGMFNGNNKSISNFTRTKGLGLFGVLTGAVVKNITLTHSQQSGGASGGAVAFGMQGVQNSKGGTNRALLVDTRVIGGSVSGTDTVGGIIGSIEDGAISGSSASNSVTSNNIAGGIVGYTTNLNLPQNTILSSSFSGQVAVQGGFSGQAQLLAGGIVGLSDSPLVITDAYSSGAVTSVGEAGGVAGKFNGQVSSVYVTSAVTGVTNTGGFFGETDSAGTNTITSSFSNAHLSTTGLPSSMGSIAGLCSNLNISNFFTNGNLVGCGTSANSSASSITNGNYSTIQLFVAALQPMFSAWNGGSWAFTATAFPIIR